MRKSWAMGDLAISVAHGLNWLGHFPCNKGRVLLIDNELGKWEMQRRLLLMVKERGLPLDSNPFDCVSLRDDGLMDLERLAEMMSPDRHDLIILDALYRFYPEQFDENSNADWTRLSNIIDKLSRKTGAAIINVHHAAKGDQNNKAVTDTGAGGGAQSRAADCHIVLRADKRKGQPQDEAPNFATLTAVVRSFKPVGKICLEWKYPFWKAIENQSEAINKTSPSTKEYADKYATAEYESRVTIETRAKEDMTVREARETFDGAVAEGFLELKANEDGRKYPKLFRNRSVTDDRWG